MRILQVSAAKKQKFSLLLMRLTSKASHLITVCSKIVISYLLHFCQLTIKKFKNWRKKKSKNLPPPNNYNIHSHSSSNNINL